MDWFAAQSLGSLDTIEDGYRLMNQALKARVEAGERAAADRYRPEVEGAVRCAPGGSAPIGDGRLI